ncbi:MAG: Toxin-antitoxin system, antitoxin component, Xre family [Candidatus Woesebacteria bacterium GW2011_GWA1_33_30]|uniref:Toxin-antitoxin system, antitoxin component, Xre family n=1 Tax=Candidatus Woesebacteria bacterium GW2011_GWA2_33_28 TaxID=1618561 RepID=A0A0F9ZTA1_9BACT|nr:MAG: Toxin-antitoxin system, antitoxin component, Xre family [Candidatus Woesebacteria bacterium GW2011_GWA2_33_28]KKP48405.1 MAG: Toxin-antitoxin system, antitoxin component, Xre family [Candidatus Woesebacteria bacterium GW2011_GWA1_33_30]KKP49512.1 MAG: Toxin-antitoxin system, antitoxin component, Xre family [Microgenomates group bacterium GW2011_GWC1_33_32]KKP52477.1 MAG: Toxin-antitoxin system, antitoxin component, Xre family [Candidatus Woesebacteria bacterium GW2011_GWB1_33_38]KKP5833
MITFEEILKKQLKNKEFRKEWEKSEPHYQLTSAIIKARIENKLTQKELARKAKTTQAVISRIQNATVSPTIDLLQRIAEGLGKKLEIKFA